MDHRSQNGLIEDIVFRAFALETKQVVLGKPDVDVSRLGQIVSSGIPGFLQLVLETVGLLQALRICHIFYEFRFIGDRKAFIPPLRSSFSRNARKGAKRGGG
jgi:hypothetical protein